MRLLTRALCFARRQCILTISSRPIRTSWRLPTAPIKLTALHLRPFSSTQLNASFQDRRNEEFERLTKEEEEKTQKKKLRSDKRWNYGWLVIWFPVLGWVFWHQSKLETSVWQENEYMPFTITKREQVSSTAFILTVRPQLGPSNRFQVDPYKESWRRGTWVVSIAQPEMQIARAYTPLPPTGYEDRCDELRFLIRVERRGEVSGYLNRLPVGSKVHIRGGRGPGFAGLDVEDMHKMGVTNMVFLVGGTGIAPAMQFAHSLLEEQQHQEDWRPKMHIVWANRRREDCLGGNGEPNTSEGKRMNRIVKELEVLKSKHLDQLSIDYVVDEERTSIDESKVLQIARTMPAPSTGGPNYIFVSGPEGFVKYFTGQTAMERVEWGENLPVGGLLGRMNLRGWEVIQLD